MGHGLQLTSSMLPVVGTECLNYLVSRKVLWSGLMNQMCGEIHTQVPGGLVNEGQMCESWLCAVNISPDELANR